MTAIVSVIISTFNRSWILPTAIGSVLSQAFGDFELIIVDDGSTDETRQVVTSFADPRIRYVFQSNAGLAAGRNTGIRESRTRYITFLDDDDVYLSNKLSSQVSFMETDKNLGWSAGGHLETDLEGHVLTQWRPWLNHPELDTATWLFDCPTCPAAVMVTRDWIERIHGFDNLHDVIDDWDAWLRLSYAGCKMAWLKEIVCEYRLHGTNMIRNTTKLRNRRLTMLDNFYAQDNLPMDLAQSKSRALALTYLQHSCHEYAQGFIPEARADLSRAVQLEPRFLDNGGDYVLEVLCGQAERPLYRDDAAFMQRALDNLPPEVAALPRIRQRGLAKLAMLKFFRAAQQEDWGKMRQVLPRAILNDSKWLLNRGVWSLGTTAFLGPTVVGKARPILQRLLSLAKAGD